jgi:hypothetical protein
VLFQTRFHDPIRRGDITTTVRIWQKLRVKPCGRYALGSGAIVVDRIHEVALHDITSAIARRCGFLSLVDLLKTAKHGAGERVFLIDFHYVDAPPTSAAKHHRLDAAELAQMLERLAAMDARAARPWIVDALQIIADRPGTRAGDLAAALGRERLEFKQDVRKLKALGLTISPETGYRLSDRGLHVLQAMKKPRRAKARKST